MSNIIINIQKRIQLNSSYISHSTTYILIFHCMILVVIRQKSCKNLTCSTGTSSPSSITINSALCFFWGGNLCEDLLCVGFGFLVNGSSRTFTTISSLSLAILHFPFFPKCCREEQYPVVYKTHKYKNKR